MKELIYNNGRYVSPDIQVGWFTNAFRTQIFTAKIASIVCRAANLINYEHYETEDWVNSSHETVRLLESLGVKFDIEGVDNIPKVDGPVVFIGNHMSTLETFVMPLLIQSHKNVVYVIKESLTRMPFFGAVVNARTPIVVSRTNPREDFKIVIEEGTKHIEANRSIIVYPQTTRSETFDPTSFGSIGIKLAKKTGVPVIPVALKTDAWGNGKLIKDIGSIDAEKTVHFSFGEPIEVKGNGKAEHQHVIDFIAENLEAWS